MDGRCKKHPKHLQSPGVCSLCLRERLAQLSTPSSCSSRRPSNMTAGSSSPSSLSSYYSSTSASSCASPMQRYDFEGKGSSSNKSMMFLLTNGKHAFTKSRSLAFDNRNNNKGGFWFNLLHPTRKRREEPHQLVPSRTLRL
ncbi:putative Avr9/Cf-9 rapidly elicited protein [Quillaja saponaria]|uniref:Avr9/Cf-9 rapidly elicited protein n=1 Tax=Quillaja saponaria TaxID=32244 RepID=A0AAD7LIV3_QUISA|nr:putative Avr9/Cf-9 rapidly elicited protein [Quillaja saponaria]